MKLAVYHARKRISSEEIEHIVKDLMVKEIMES
jgi:hypothetical protein